MGDRRRGGPFQGVSFEDYLRQRDQRAQRVQGLLSPSAATARRNRRAAGEGLWAFASGDKFRESMRQGEMERTGFDPLQPGIEPISRFDMFRARTQRALRDSPLDLMSRVANVTMGASPGEALEPVPGAGRAAGGVFRMVPGMAERARFRGTEGLADMPIEAIPAVKTSEGRIITGPTHPTIVRQAYERGDIPMDDDIVPGFIDKQSGEFVGRYDAETGGLLTRAGLSPGAIRRAERIPGHENVPFGEYVPETGAAGRGVPLVRRHANEFMENRRPDLMENHPGEFEYLPKDPELGKRTADLYESLPHAPNDPVVRASYRAFKDETLDQYKFLTEEKGIKFEPWEGEGQPYENSQEMIDDVRENKRLFYFKTEEGFGKGDNAVPDHPMLEKVEINGEEVPYNDLFRAVHDYFGHAAEGVSFGPRGEFNAANVHSAMYSPEARGSMLFETHGQNSWVNFGQQIRRADGSIPQKGDPDYVGLGEREFAEQKANVLPLDMGPPAARGGARGAEEATESLTPTLDAPAADASGQQTITYPNGIEAVVRPQGDALEVIYIGPPGAGLAEEGVATGAADLGPAGVRKIYRDLFERFPEARSLEGGRLTGARAGQRSSVPRGRIMEATESLTPTLDAMSPEEIAEGLAEVERRSAASPRGKNLDRRQSAESGQRPLRAPAVRLADGSVHDAPGPSTTHFNALEEAGLDPATPSGEVTFGYTDEGGNFVPEPEAAELYGLDPNDDRLSSEFFREQGFLERRVGDRREIDDIEEQLAGRLRGDIEARRALGLDLGGGSGDARAGEEQVRQGLTERLERTRNPGPVPPPGAPADLFQPEATIPILRELPEKPGNAFDLAQARLNRDTATPEAMAARRAEIEQGLTPEELEWLQGSKSNVVANVEEAYSMLPDPETMAHAAIRGAEARGWYHQGHRAIQEMVGEQDTPRFAALMSALSPNKPVDEDLALTIEAWGRWNRAGRPQDEATIREIVENLEVDRTPFRPDEAADGKPFRALAESDTDNIVRALTASDEQLATLDPEILSGPKVGPFFSSLGGRRNQLVSDTHMARGYGTTPDRVGKKARGAAQNAMMENATRAFERITGEPVTREELQEMSWAYIRGLSRARKGGPIKKDETALQALEESLLNPERAQNLNDEITSSASIGELMAQPAFRELAERNGLPLPTPRPTYGFRDVNPADADVNALRNIAERIDASRAGQPFYSAAPIAGLLGVTPLRERYERERRRQRRR